MEIIMELMKNKAKFEINDVDQPNLYREQFPYTEIPRILFDHSTPSISADHDIWITDTTFRDGQQARAPYSIEQIVKLFEFLHRLGGKKGIIRQSEFFVYSIRDREAIKACMDKGFQYPEITGWIRASADDLKIVKELGLKETGILTSVSDYHIFHKLKSTRAKITEEYLDIARSALDSGIIPRCHFEDITRADIYGFCLPLAEKLLELGAKYSMPVKVRLCDTLGFGVTYPGASLPRSVPKLVHAFKTELGFPSEHLEWHGHNDFHQVHINGTTAWLYGVSALNATLLGFGERTGNPPLEAAIIELIQLKGENSGIDTTVITEIAEYFKKEIHAEVAENYPFVGNEFNTTRAGIHADGLLKNPEIYNIFDTDKFLKRPIKISITDKSGVAGIAHWIMEYIEGTTGKHEEVSKRHPGVKRINSWIIQQYENGRTTSISTEEMIAQSKRHLPSLFESDFKKVVEKAVLIARNLSEKISSAPEILSLNPETTEPFLEDVIKEVGSLQLLAITDAGGYRISQVHTQRGEKALFRNLLTKNFHKHEWFVNAVTNGSTYISDLYFSKYTDRLIITIAIPVKSKDGKVVAVIDFDFMFEELVKLINNVPEEIMEVALE
jgi:citrate (Re)-synthase